MNRQNKFKCPICKSFRNFQYWAMPGYPLLRCEKCGMVWDPYPSSDLESIYGVNYFINENPKGGYANYFEGMNINKKTFYERIKRINRKIGKRGRMLDIGSALGDSLVEAKLLGWKNLYGVELSKYAARESQKKGLNVKIGTLKKAAFPSNYFDVVTLQDVVEHFKDPLAELKEVYRVLRTDGIVFVVTPDVDGFWAKLLGKLWYHYKPGEHIIYLSQKTLKKALVDVGFKNIETRKTYHTMSLEYIFNRLRFYSPRLFGGLLKLVRGNFLGKISFRVYIGEIEGWGIK
jgi:SAM-dependent methyltransferase